MSAGCTVKCDPGLLLSNGAEILFIIVTRSGQTEIFNFSLMATNEPKWWFNCFFVVVLLIRKFNTVGIIYLGLSN